MNTDDDFAALVDQCVRFDWKTPMDEILPTLRYEWGDRYAFLREESLDALAENYAGESPPDQFLALGQEMTVHGFALHAVDEGSDDYALVMIPLEEQKAFAAWLKKTGRKTELLKQSRKKTGSPAKRIKTANRIIVDAFDLAAPSTFASFHFPGQKLALLTRYHYSEEGAHEYDTCSWLDCAAWPPKEHPSEHVFGTVDCSPEHGLWAVARKTGREEGELWVTDSPVSPTFSRRVAFPESPGWREKRAADPAWECYNVDTFRPLSSLCWMGDDLFVTRQWVNPGSMHNEVHVWVARGAAQGETACEKVLVTPPLARPGTQYSAVARTGNGERRIMLGGWFYAWENGMLRATGVECRTVSLDPVATGAHRFAYAVDWGVQIYVTNDEGVLTHDYHFVRFTDNSGGLLAEHDLQTGKIRRRPLPGLYPNLSAVRLTETVVAFHGWGRPASAHDLALIWDMQTDEWLRLRYGALGPYGPMDMLAVSETDWILKGEERLYRVHDLQGQLRRDKRNRLEPPAWSEWLPELAPDPPPTLPNKVCPKVWHQSPPEEGKTATEQTTPGTPAGFPEKAGTPCARRYLPIWIYLLLGLPLLLEAACRWLAGRAARRQYRLAHSGADFSADEADALEQTARDKDTILTRPLGVIVYLIDLVRKKLTGKSYFP
jgi:hypothetical protein